MTLEDDLQLDASPPRDEPVREQTATIRSMVQIPQEPPTSETACYYFVPLGFGTV